jgi:hypothetical protein
MAMNAIGNWCPRAVAEVGCGARVTTGFENLVIFKARHAANQRGHVLRFSDSRMAGICREEIRGR